MLCGFTEFHQAKLHFCRDLGFWHVLVFRWWPAWRLFSTRSSFASATMKPGPGERRKVPVQRRIPCKSWSGSTRFAGTLVSTPPQCAFWQASWACTAWGHILRQKSTWRRNCKSGDYELHHFLLKLPFQSGFDSSFFSINHGDGMPWLFSLE